MKNRPFFTFLAMFQCKSLRKSVLDMAANRAALILVGFYLDFLLDFFFL